MPTTRRFQDSRTGQTHEVEWNQDHEPSDREIEVLINQAKRAKTAPATSEPEDDRYWFNKPMSGGAITRWFKDKTNDLRKSGDEKSEPYFQPDSWLGKAESGFHTVDKALSHGTADVVDFFAPMTDLAPLDAAVLAATGGGSRLASTGMRGIEALAGGGRTAYEAALAANSANAANKVRAGVNIARAGAGATGLRGAYNTVAGLTPDDEGKRDYSQAGFGALEAALSAAGFHSAGKSEAAKVVADSVAKDLAEQEAKDAAAKLSARRANIFDALDAPNTIRDVDVSTSTNKRPYNAQVPHGPGKPDYASPLGPFEADFKEPIGPKPAPKRLGSGIRFQGIGDVIADTQNPRTTRSKEPTSVADIMKEADRRGVILDDQGRALPARQPPYSGTGSLQYDEAGNVLREDRLGRRINRPKVDLPDIEATPLRSERVEPKPRNNPIRNIDPEVPIDPKKIINDIYQKMDEKILEVLRKQGDKGAIKELAKRRGETGSLFGGEKGDTPEKYGPADIANKARGLGARIVGKAKGLLDTTPNTAIPNSAVEKPTNLAAMIPDELPREAAPKPKSILPDITDEKGALTVNRGKPYFKKDGTFNAETNPKVIVKRIKQDLPVARRWDETRFLTPDGMRYSHNHYIHESALNELGTSLKAAGESAGVVRIAEDARGAEIRRPITYEQATQLADMPHFNSNHELYIDVHGADGRLYSKDFNMDSTPDQIRNWVQSKYNKVPEANPLNILKSETGAVKWESGKGKRAQAAAKASAQPTVVTPSEANKVAEGSKPVVTNELPKADNIFTRVRRNMAMINDPDPVIKKMKAPYQEWVNTRNASRGVGYNIKQDFKSLDEMGKDGIQAYMSGERGGKLKDVADWFKDTHKKFITAGIKEDVPMGKIFDNTDEEVKHVFGNKKLVLKPGDEFKPIMDVYKEGIEGKLTPRLKSIPDMMSHYNEVVDNAIAGKKFYDFLDDNNIRNHPKVQKILDNYLNFNDKRDPAMKALLRGIQLTKDISMASGLPGTAFNAHGFNMVRRSYTANGIEGLARSLGYMMNPGTESSVISRNLEKIMPWTSAAKNIENNRQLIPQIMKDGGTLGFEGHEFDQALSDAALGKWGNKVADKVTEIHHDLFETHLFDKMIPSLKIDFYKSTLEDLVKSGVEKGMAGKQAAKAMNLAFAGINYNELATNKGMMDMARVVFLAPDWYASNLGLAKNVAQSFNPWAKNPHPGGLAYRNIGKGLLSAYATANALNYALTSLNSEDGKGKFMFQNDTGRSLDIDTGTYTVNAKGDRKKVYISPFGTAFDAGKILGGVIAESVDDSMTGTGSPVRAVINPVKNRLSLPAHMALNVLSGVNDLGRSYIGRDAYGNDLSTGSELMGLAKEVTSPFTPAYVKGAAGFALGNLSPLEALNQSIEAPLSFSKVPTVKGSGKPSRPRRPARR